MPGGMQVPQNSQGHLESSCGQREPSSQPLNTHPRASQLGDSPHLTALRPTSTKATPTRGERAWHQSGSKPSPAESPGPQEGPAFTPGLKGGREEEEMLGG